MRFTSHWLSRHQKSSLSPPSKRPAAQPPPFHHPIASTPPCDLPSTWVRRRSLDAVWRLSLLSRIHFNISSLAPTEFPRDSSRFPRYIYTYLISLSLSLFYLFLSLSSACTHTHTHTQGRPFVVRASWSISSLYGRRVILFIFIGTAVSSFASLRNFPRRVHKAGPAFFARLSSAGHHHRVV